MSSFHECFGTYDEQEYSCHYCNQQNECRKHTDKIIVITEERNFPECFKCLVRDDCVNIYASECCFNNWEDFCDRGKCPNKETCKAVTGAGDAIAIIEEL